MDLFLYKYCKKDKTEEDRKVRELGRTEGDRKKREESDMVTLRETERERRNNGKYSSGLYLFTHVND